MTYEQARNYIKSVAKTGMNLGLSRMRELCRRLGDPQDTLSFIHIAGTNGKGSTAAYISSILASSGYMVGRYVSPVVFRYEECMQYEDGRGIHYIDKELLAQLVTRVAEVVDEMMADGWESPTVFEIETAVSFLAFCHWQCTVVLLEVGLGGREDATNIIHHVLASVITPISKDHTGVLGDTLEEIARAKAGIIKEAGLVITYQKEAGVLHVIESEAKTQRADVVIVKQQSIKVLSADLHGTTFFYEGGQWQTIMPGIYQVENACLAIETCRHLQLPNPISQEKLFQGVYKAVWRGRFEVVDTEPLTILDGAHNIAGAEALAKTIEQLLPDKKLHGIMGVFQDKEYKTMIHILRPYFAEVIAITAPGARGMDKMILAEEWKKQGCPFVSVAESVADAKEMATAHCKEGEAIVLFGSLSFFKEYPYDEKRK